MANMFEKYAADREAEQKKIEKTVAADATDDEKRTAVAHGERQEGAEDDGGGARDDDCRDYPRVGRGAYAGGG
mgnify:CR=1 FL=1